MTNECLFDKNKNCPIQVNAPIYDPLSRSKEGLRVIAEFCKTCPEHLQYLKKLLKEPFIFR